jgi:acetyl esterase/lipase
LCFLDSGINVFRSSRLLLVLAALPLSGCSGLAVLNTITPGPSVPVVTLSYGPSERQKVDVYPAVAPDVSPSTAPIRGAQANNPISTQQLRPIVIFFYGGAWHSGSRQDYRFVAKSFTDMGYVVAIPDYRLAPEVVYPDFLRDSAAAVQAVIANARSVGGDPDRIILAGHSAGAYNAAMLAMDSRWLTPTDRKRIRGFIGLASPVNFLPIQMPEARRAFSWPNTPNDTQPIAHVSKESPPMLLITAEVDPLVDPDINSRAMARRLQALGVAVTVQTYSGPLGMINHANLVATLSPRLSFLAPTLEDSREFIERVVR